MMYIIVQEKIIYFSEEKPECYIEAVEVPDIRKSNIPLSYFGMMFFERLLMTSLLLDNIFSVPTDRLLSRELFSSEIARIKADAKIFTV